MLDKSIICSTGAYHPITKHVFLHCDTAGSRILRQIWICINSCLSSPRLIWVRFVVVGFPIIIVVSLILYNHIMEIYAGKHNWVKFFHIPTSCRLPNDCKFCLKHSKSSFNVLVICLLFCRKVHLCFSMSMPDRLDKCRPLWVDVIIEIITNVVMLTINFIV
jgi:hypothetical protein